MIKNIKTPLRYPGGKSRAVKFLKNYFPETFIEYREPFFGGGSVGLYIAQNNNNIKIKVNDINYSLYSFWNTLKLFPDDMINEIKILKNKFNIGRELYDFIYSRRTSNISMLDNAIYFFILNRITFSGLVDSGGYSERAFLERFTEKSIDRLREVYSVIKDFEFSSKDFSDSIKMSGEKVFIFLDPPYYSTSHSKLYGKCGNLHTNFNHNRLYDLLSNINHKFMLTYDDNEHIRKLYKKFNIIEWNLQYGMNNYKQNKAAVGKELLICNYDIHNLFN